MKEQLQLSALEAKQLTEVGKSTALENARYTITNSIRQQAARGLSSLYASTEYQEIIDELREAGYKVEIIKPNKNSSAFYVTPTTYKSITITW